MKRLLRYVCALAIALLCAASPLRAQKMMCPYVAAFPKTPDQTVTQGNACCLKLDAIRPTPQGMTLDEVYINNYNYGVSNSGRDNFFSHDKYSSTSGNASGDFTLDGVNVNSPNGIVDFIRFKVHTRVDYLTAPTSSTDQGWTVSKVRFALVSNDGNNVPFHNLTCEYKLTTPYVEGRKVVKSITPIDGKLKFSTSEEITLQVYEIVLDEPYLQDLLITLRAEKNGDRYISQEWRFVANVELEPMEVLSVEKDPPFESETKFYMTEPVVETQNLEEDEDNFPVLDVVGGSCFIFKGMSLCIKNIYYYQLKSSSGKNYKPTPPTAVGDPQATPLESNISDPNDHYNLVYWLMKGDVTGWSDDVPDMRRVTVTVKDASTGVGLDGVTVTANANGSDPVSGTTNPSGEVVLSLVVGQEYTLMATPTDCHQGASCSLDANSTKASLNLAAQTKSTTFKLVDVGGTTPIAGVNLRVKPKGSTDPASEQTVAGDGTASLELASCTEYTCEVDNPDDLPCNYGTINSQTFTPKDLTDGVFTFTLPVLTMKEVSIYVKDAGNNDELVGGLTVSLGDVQLSWDPSMPGKYIGEVTPCVHSVTVVDPENKYSLQDPSATVDLRQSDQGVVKVIKQKPKFTVAIKVVDKDSQEPIENATVKLTYQGGTQNVATWAPNKKNYQIFEVEEGTNITQISVTHADYELPPNYTMPTIGEVTADLQTPAATVEMVRKTQACTLKFVDNEGLAVHMASGDFTVRQNNQPLTAEAKSSTTGDPLCGEFIVRPAQGLGPVMVVVPAGERFVATAGTNAHNAPFQLSSTEWKVELERKTVDFTVRVVDGGMSNTPIVPDKVEGVMTACPGSPASIAPTQNTGVYSTTLYAGEEYSFSASKEGYSEATGTTTPSATNTEITLTLSSNVHTYPLELTIRDASTNLLKDVEIQLGDNPPAGVSISTAQLQDDIYKLNLYIEKSSAAEGVTLKLSNPKKYEDLNLELQLSDWSGVETLQKEVEMTRKFLTYTILITDGTDPLAIEDSDLQVLPKEFIHEVSASRVSDGTYTVSLYAGETYTASVTKEHFGSASQEFTTDLDVPEAERTVKLVLSRMEATYILDFRVKLGAFIVTEPVEIVLIEPTEGVTMEPLVVPPTPSGDSRRVTLKFPSGLVTQLKFRITPSDTEYTADDVVLSVSDLQAPDYVNIIDVSLKPREPRIFLQKLEGSKTPTLYEILSSQTSGSGGTVGFECTPSSKSSFVFVKDGFLIAREVVDVPASGQAENEVKLQVRTFHQAPAQGEIQLRLLYEAGGEKLPAWNAHVKMGDRHFYSGYDGGIWAQDLEDGTEYHPEVLAEHGFKHQTIGQFTAVSSFPVQDILLELSSEGDLPIQPQRYEPPAAQSVRGTPRTRGEKNVRFTIVDRDGQPLSNVKVYQLSPDALLTGAGSYQENFKRLDDLTRDLWYEVSSVSEEEAFIQLSVGGKLVDPPSYYTQAQPFTQPSTHGWRFPLAGIKKLSVSQLGVEASFQPVQGGSKEGLSFTVEREKNGRDVTLEVRRDPDGAPIPLDVQHWVNPGETLFVSMARVEPGSEIDRPIFRSDGGYDLSPWFKAEVMDGHEVKGQLHVPQLSNSDRSFIISAHVVSQPMRCSVSWEVRDDYGALSSGATVRILHGQEDIKDSGFVDKGLVLQPLAQIAEGFEFLSINYTHGQEHVSPPITIDDRAFTGQEFIIQNDFAFQVVVRALNSRTPINPVIPTGIDSPSLADLQAFPIPPRHVLTLRGAGQATSYVLFNALGRVLRRGLLSGQDQAQIDVQDLPSGLYILQVNDPDGRRKILHFVK